MATEVQEPANGNLKKEEAEPLGELRGKEDLKQAPADLCHAGDVNGCEPVAEKEEPLKKVPTPNKQKGIVLDGVDEEGATEPQDGNDYSSEEEEGDGEGEEDAREGDSEPYEEENDEEYADDGEDDDGDDDESQPPPKRRK
ncbi:hypothetical protein GOP47_0011845 [Adiantum capillus-veneris]|nr:hypothetical protein GOP47_0011845 [Adiantum capillus-veneris]